MNSDKCIIINYSYECFEWDGLCMQELHIAVASCSRIIHARLAAMIIVNFQPIHHHTLQINLSLAEHRAGIVIALHLWTKLLWIKSEWFNGGENIRRKKLSKKKEALIADANWTNQHRLLDPFGCHNRKTNRCFIDQLNRWINKWFYIGIEIRSFVSLLFVNPLLINV